MDDVGRLWVELYGNGFEPDYTGILSSLKPERLLKDKEKPEFFAEFLGTKEDMDKEVFRNLRIQLVKYIKLKMEEEYDSFGGKEQILSYWKGKMKQKKSTLIDAFCLSQYYNDHPEEKPAKEQWKGHPLDFSSHYKVKFSDIWTRITKYEKHRPSGFCLNDMPLYDGRYLENTYDDLTGHKCNIFFQVTFHNWKDMEDLIGEPLPKIFVGYSERGILGYNGNSILDAVDAVGDIISPLYGGKRPSNGEKYDSCYFDVWMGFSKAGWKKVYENWLRNTGRESEIERIKQEKKEKAKKENQKRDLPARPYEPSSFILNCENSEELIQIEKELDSVFPGKRIGSISTVNKVNVISASTSIKVKENKEKIEKLKELGWHTGRKYKGSDDCFYVNLSKNVSQKK